MGTEIARAPSTQNANEPSPHRSQPLAPDKQTINPTTSTMKTTAITRIALTCALLALLLSVSLSSVRCNSTRALQQWGSYASSSSSASCSGGKCTTTTNTKTSGNGYASGNAYASNGQSTSESTSTSDKDGTDADCSVDGKKGTKCTSKAENDDEKTSEKCRFRRGKEICFRLSGGKCYKFVDDVKGKKVNKKRCA